MTTKIFEVQIAPEDMKQLEKLMARWHKNSIQATLLHCVSIAADWAEDRDDTWESETSR